MTHLRREEVVTYEAGGLGKKLGSLAASKGLSRDEQDVVKASLGDLCAKLMTASRTQLARSNSSASEKPVRNVNRPFEAGEPLPAFKG